MVRLEPKDIFLQRVYLLTQIFALFHVSAVEITHETPVENRFHRANSRKKFLYGLEVVAVEHSRIISRFIAVGLVKVPSAEDQVIQRGEGDKFGDFR